MSIANMRNAAMPDEQSGSDTARSYNEELYLTLPQRLSDGKRIRRPSRVVELLTHLPGQDGTAEIIAAKEQAFAAPLSPPQPRAWPECEDGLILEAGVYKHKREAG